MEICSLKFPSSFSILSGPCMQCRGLDSGMWASWLPVPRYPTPPAPCKVWRNRLLLPMLGLSQACIMFSSSMLSMRNHNHLISLNHTVLLWTWRLANAILKMKNPYSGKILRFILSSSKYAHTCWLSYQLFFLPSQRSFNAFDTITNNFVFSGSFYIMRAVWDCVLFVVLK